MNHKTPCFLWVLAIQIPYPVSLRKHPFKGPTTKTCPFTTHMFFLQIWHLSPPTTLFHTGIWASFTALTPKKKHPTKQSWYIYIATLSETTPDKMLSQLKGSFSNHQCSGAMWVSEKLAFLARFVTLWLHFFSGIPKHVFFLHERYMKLAKL